MERSQHLAELFCRSKICSWVHKLDRTAKPTIGATHGLVPGRNTGHQPGGSLGSPALSPPGSTRSRQPDCGGAFRGFASRADKFQFAQWDSLCP